MVYRLKGAAQILRCAPLSGKLLKQLIFTSLRSTTRLKRGVNEMIRARTNQPVEPRFSPGSLGNEKKNFAPLSSSASAQVRPP